MRIVVRAFNFTVSAVDTTLILKLSAIGVIGGFALNAGLVVAHIMVQ